MDNWVRLVRLSSEQTDVENTQRIDQLSSKDTIVWPNEHIVSQTVLTALVQRLRTIGCVAAVVVNTQPSIQTLAQAINEDWFRFCELHVARDVNLAYAFLDPLWKWMTTRPSIRTLSIHCDASANMRDSHPLLCMLRTRTAPLDLNIDEVYHVMLWTPILELYLHEWKCVHAGRLRIPQWPKTVAGGMELNHVWLQSNVMREYNAQQILLAWLRCGTNKIRTLTIKNSYHGSGCMYYTCKSSMEALLNFTLIRDNETSTPIPISSKQEVTFLIRHRKELLHLQHLQTNNITATALKRLLTSFPRLERLTLKLRYGELKQSERMPSVPFIPIRCLAIRTSQGQYLSAQLAHENGGLRTLVLLDPTFEFHTTQSASGPLLLPTPSHSSQYGLRTILAPFAMPSSDFAAYCVDTFPNLLFVPIATPFFQREWLPIGMPQQDNIRQLFMPSYVHDVMKRALASDTTRIQEHMRMCTTLYDRQIAYVLHIEAWLQAGLLWVWFQALNDHPLQDSIFAWLPMLSELLKPHQYPDEIFLSEHDECDWQITARAQLKYFWYLSDPNIWSQIVHQFVTKVVPRFMPLKWLTCTYYNDAALATPMHPKQHKWKKDAV